MKDKIRIISINFLLIFGLIYLISPDNLIAQVMSSQNYKIFIDSINPGGALGNSSNYNLTDTFGEVGTDETTSSTNYRAKVGFEAIQADQILTASLSKNTINLGVLSPNNVVNDSHTITVTTNGNGYTTTIISDGNLRTSGSDDINNVSDGTVTAGSEEYGIRTSGDDGQQNSADTSITTTAKNIARRTSAVNSSITTIDYKASVTTSTPFGTYSQIVTFSTTGNF